MHAGNLRLDPRPGVLQSARGDIHSFVKYGFLPVCGGFEQQARLVGRAGAKLGNAQADQLVSIRRIGVGHAGIRSAGLGHDVGGVGGKNPPLRPRQIVLRQLRNLVEQPRAVSVVEEPGRQALVPVGEPFANCDGNKSLSLYSDLGITSTKKRFIRPAGFRRTASGSPARRNCDSWREYERPE